MWTWYVGGAVLLLIVLAVLRINRKYGRAFSGSHLREFSRLLFALRDRAAPAERGEAEPVFDVTSANLALAYSIGTEEGGVVHHISMSHREGYLARATSRCGGRSRLPRCRWNRRARGSPT